MIARPIPWARLAWDVLCLACIAVVAILIGNLRDADDRQAPRVLPASLRSAPECGGADQVWREVRAHVDPKRRAS